MKKEENLTVLLSAVQANHGLIEKVGIKSPAIIINQTNRTGLRTFKKTGGNISFYSFAERGVGLSRNNALMRCKSGFALLADEDEKLSSNYYEEVIKAFRDIPHADVIVFNLRSDSSDRRPYENSKVSRVRIYNSLRYGACRIAFRVEKIHEANIYFSLLFGGGAKYGSGEDTIFLTDCLKKGLKVYAHPYYVGEVSFNSSSWFSGYTKKFFIDKGVLLKNIFGRLYLPVGCYIALRLYPKYRNKFGYFSALKLMVVGSRDDYDHRG